MANKEELSRRAFLKKSGSALLVLGGAAVGLPLVGCSNAQVQKEGKVSIENSNGLIVELGDLQELQQGPHPIEVRYKTTIKDGWYQNPVEGLVYVTLNEGTQELMVLSSVCTHLGCTVPFATESAKAQVKKENLVFYCPCHGGQYDEQGINIGGPPPRPLDIFQPILQDNKVYIHIMKGIKREA